MEEKGVVTFSNLPPRDKWSRKHLNWSLVLYGWLVYIPMCIAMIVGIESLAIGFMVMAFGLGWYLLAWNLEHKGRSLWNLLYTFIPYVGVIIFLFIRNQHQLEELRKQEKAIDEMFEGKQG